MTDKNTLKNWFRTGLKPMQNHFWNWIDSYWHKSEKIPLANIDGIGKALENKAETSALDGKVDKVEGKGLSTHDYTTAEKDKLAELHNYDDSDLRGMIATKANTNADNLSDEDANAWKEKLNLDIPTLQQVVEKGKKYSYSDNDKAFTLSLSEGFEFSTYNKRTGAERGVRIDQNGIYATTLTLNPLHSYATGNSAYTKQVVAKEDGTLGLVDRVETLSQEKLVDVQFQTMPMFTEENSVSNSDELALTISETSIIPTGTIIEAKIILPNYKGYITAMRVTKESFSIRIPKKFESLFSPAGATTQGKLYLRFIKI